MPTGFVGTTRYFWGDELQVALETSSVGAITVDDKKFYLHSRLYRSDFYSKVLQYVSSLDEEKRTEACDCIFAQLGESLTEDDMKEHRFLDWPQISEMDGSGLVMFGSHSVNHPNLTLLSEGSLKLELEESKGILEDRLGKAVLAFAYPYGGPGFFDSRIINELQGAGYSCAFTTMQGRVGNKREEKFKLKRVMLFEYQNRGTMALKLDRFSDSRGCSH